MPDIYIPGTAGRLETKFVSGPEEDAPVAIFLHPHAHLGGGMNHSVIYQLFYALHYQGFSCVRFNFRGVGNSVGHAGDGEGEMLDAATVLDWAQEKWPKAKRHWVVGFSFGAWIGMQLTARRPEVTNFVALSPPASIYDFSFMDESFCTAKGLIVAAGMDNITPFDYMTALQDLVGNVELETIAGSNHFFDCYLTDVVKTVDDFARRVA